MSAVIGIGNCASALVQGVHFYQNAPEDAFIPGLMHARLGPYHVRDIEFTAAFDIDVNKVGKDLSEAIFAPPNNTYRFAEVPYLNVPVYRGMTHDSLGKYLSQVIQKAPGPTADIRPGNALPLRNIPLGTMVHNIELQPGKGGQMVRSAGTSRVGPRPSTSRAMAIPTRTATKRCRW